MNNATYRFLFSADQVKCVIVEQYRTTGKWITRMFVYNIGTGELAGGEALEGVCMETPDLSPDGKYLYCILWGPLLSSEHQGIVCQPPSFVPLLTLRNPCKPGCVREQCNCIAKSGSNTQLL
jgi:hypothetical protein